MNVKTMISRVRVHASCQDINRHTDVDLRHFLSTAYENIIEELSLSFPYISTRTEDLTLTGVYTDLPTDAVGAIIEVQDVTGIASTSEGTRMDLVEPQFRGRYGEAGYYLRDNKIGITQGWEGRTLRISYRFPPEEFTSDLDTPKLIPSIHHMALVWHAVKLLEIRDAGTASPGSAEEARQSRNRLVAALSQHQTIHNP